MKHFCESRYGRGDDSKNEVPINDLFKESRCGHLPFLDFPFATFCEVQLLKPK